MRIFGALFVEFFFSVHNPYQRKNRTHVSPSLISVPHTTNNLRFLILFTKNILYSLEHNRIVGGGRRDINVVHTGAGTTDGLDVTLASGQHFGGDLGVGAHDQRIVVLYIPVVKN